MLSGKALESTTVQLIFKFKAVTMSPFAMTQEVPSPSYVYA